MGNWQNLLMRFLRNETTEREKKIVFHALRDGWADEDFIAAIETVMNDPLIIADTGKQEAISDGILRIIRRKIVDNREEMTESPRFVIPQWMKIAALIVIFFSIGFLTHFQIIKKGENRESFNTIVVPAGQTANLTLADGTAVWLNSRTVMRYPDHFNSGNRNIFLEGEAFFNVAKREESPFVVHTSYCDIRALGTQFNVEAYPSGNFAAALMEGSIELTPSDKTMQNLVLKPNMVAYIDNGEWLADSISDLSYYRWREGLVCVKDMTFDELMKKFEKCYDVRILVENQRVKKEVYTGKFRYSDGIDHALRVLRRNVRFNFTRDEDIQVIIIK